MKAYVLTPEGERQEAAPRPRGRNHHPSTFCLDEMRDIVGGWIEVIRLTDEVVMVVNEDGKLNDLEYNRRATELFRKVFPKNPDFIVGKALVCESSMIE